MTKKSLRDQYAGIVLGKLVKVTQVPGMTTRRGQRIECNIEAAFDLAEAMLIERRRRYPSLLTRLINLCRKLTKKSGTATSGGATAAAAPKN